MKSVLIAYCSPAGSTKETALRMAAELRKAGGTADALDFAEVGSLEEYGAVVVGAPINGMSWRPEALDFVRERADELRGKELSFFLLGVSLASSSAKVRARAAKAFADAEAIVKPVRTACFGGVMSADPPAILRFLFRLPKDCPRDGRDWNAIESFALEAAQ